MLLRGNPKGILDRNSSTHSKTITCLYTNFFSSSVPPATQCSTQDTHKEQRSAPTVRVLCRRNLIHREIDHCSCFTEKEGPTKSCTFWGGDVCSQYNNMHQRNKRTGDYKQAFSSSPLWNSDVQAKREKERERGCTGHTLVHTTSSPHAIEVTTLFPTVRCCLEIPP